MTEDVKKKLESEIKKGRAEIDEIDSALLQLIARRRDVAVEIAKIKQKVGSTDDEARLKEVFTSLEKRAKELKLNPDKMRLIWKALVKYMIEEQMEKYPY
jgi:chorismate mutase